MSHLLVVGWTPCRPIRWSQVILINSPNLNRWHLRWSKWFLKLMRKFWTRHPPFFKSLFHIIDSERRDLEKFNGISIIDNQLIGLLEWNNQLTNNLSKLKKHSPSSETWNWRQNSNINIFCRWLYIIWDILLLRNFLTAKVFDSKFECFSYNLLRNFLG